MELIILECLAAFFLFLSIVRPLLRGLWKLPGLTVCPLLALGIIIGIFPAYGFRPECIPLLLFAIFLFFANLWDFLALFSSLQSDSYRDKGILFTLISAALFAYTFWIAVHFRPPMDTELITPGVKTIFIKGGELHVRIYGPIEPAESAETTEPTAPTESSSEVNPEITEDPPKRPLLVLIPPAAGSFIVSDEVCAALRDRGFTVVSFSRVNFDSPFFDQNGIPVRLNIPGLYRLGNALIQGYRYVGANAGGRELEEIRKQDTLYILSELSENRTLIDLLGHIDKNIIFMAGYGAGGAALTVLAGQDNFSAVYPNVRGIISIEAPLLSSLEGDPLPPPAVSPSDPFNALYQQAEEFARSFVPRRITHITETPGPNLPAFFILSDRVINERGGRYATILRTMAGSQNAALLAAYPGAGPFDYSSSPKQYPLISFLFRGMQPAEKDLLPEKEDWPELTASLITNFAVLILENTAPDTEIPENAVAGPDSAENLPEPVLPNLVKTALNRNIHFEQRGVWHFPGMRTILQP